MCLDFAVTSGLRNPGVSARGASSPLLSYEAFKRTHKGTEAACSAEGLGFTPMVMEAVGGAWGPSATSVLAELAKVKSLYTGESQDRVQQQLLECLSVILHRENARAVLKRSAVCSLASDGILAAATTLQADSADFQFQ